VSECTEFCEACGDCLACYGEDACSGTSDGVHVPPSREHVATSWMRVHSVDEMEAFYRSVLAAIREAARECGYAIGVHGSMRRDLDLIAAPWVADHADKDTLARAIQRAATGGIANEHYQWGSVPPKPCGRVGTVFPICWTEWHDMISAGHVDLAVMPDVERPS
jgi:hypothetical protein